MVNKVYINLGEILFLFVILCETDITNLVCSTIFEISYVP